MEEDGFTLVKRTKKGKNKVNNPSNSPGPYSKEAHPDLSTEEIQEYIRKVRSVQDTFETTDFFTDFLKTWNEVITEQSEKQNTTSIDVTNVFCLGLGSFAQNSNLTSLVASRYQLAFLLSWIKILKTTATTPQTTSPDVPQTLVFDPVLSLSEKKILRELKFNTSEENLEGCYLVNSVSKSNLTVFYLPHCPKQLLNNILWTNWDRLDRILILGNSISGIISNLLNKQLENLKYIQSASEFCHEKTLKNNFQHRDIFNNLAWHWFHLPKNTSKKLSEKKPTYPQEDLEFIQNNGC